MNDTVTVASVAGAVPVDTAYTSRRPYGIDCERSVIDDIDQNELLVLVTPDRRDPGALITADHRCRDNGRLLACTSSWADVPVADTAPFLPVIAEPVTFGQGGDGELVMTDGWGQPEVWGRVIPAEGAGIALPLVGPLEGPVAVRLRAADPFGRFRHGRHDHPRRCGARASGQR